MVPIRPAVLKLVSLCVLAITSCGEDDGPCVKLCLDIEAEVESVSGYSIDCMSTEFSEQNSCKGCISIFSAKIEIQAEDALSLCQEFFPYEEDPCGPSHASKQCEYDFWVWLDGCGVPTTDGGYCHCGCTTDGSDCAGWADPFETQLESGCHDMSACFEFLIGECQPDHEHDGFTKKVTYQNTCNDGLWCLTREVFETPKEWEQTCIRSSSDPFLPGLLESSHTDFFDSIEECEAYETKKDVVCVLATDDNACIPDSCEGECLRQAKVP